MNYVLKMLLSNWGKNKIFGMICVGVNIFNFGIIVEEMKGRIVWEVFVFI